MRLVTTILGAVVLLAMCAPAGATELVAESWRAHHGPFACDTLDQATEIAAECVLCHSDGGSSSDLNPYADDLKAEHDDSGQAWVIVITAVEPLDSDGDGVVNEVEIQEDCTFPGDALSVPVVNPSWSQLKALYE